jgi:hypothetical protein
LVFRRTNEEYSRKIQVVIAFGRGIMGEGGNINRYDERQLKLMYENLLSFEKKQIALSSLVGTLEFLLSVMESVEDDWEEKFLNEVTALESINALMIIRVSGEEAPKICDGRSNQLINDAVSNLKVLIKKKIAIPR